jgi:hypothetical protein
MMFTYPERQAIASSMAEEHFRINSHTQAEKDAFIAGVVAGIGLIERVDAQNALETVSDRVAHKDTPRACFDADTQEAPGPETPGNKGITLLPAVEPPSNGTEITGAITYRMKRRWLPHFIAMLKTMQSFGNAGHSGHVAFYADGDGDFHPKFHFYVGTTPVEELSEPLDEVRPKKTNATIEDVTLYDAG